MMTEHAPGPWRKAPICDRLQTGDDLWAILDSEGCGVAAEVVGTANADLICAAPQLLALLTQAIACRVPGEEEK